MEAQEADISLASSLDTLRATGAGASGATALAQAALRSKQRIAADIQKQEMRNAELRAQGEQKMQQLRQAERARVQTLMGRGEEARMRMQEQREAGRLDRLSGLADQYAMMGAQARSQSDAMLGSALGALGGLTGFALGGGFKKDSVEQTPSESTFIPKQDNFTFFQNLAQNYGTKTGD